MVQFFSNVMLRSTETKQFDIPQIFKNQTIGITSVLHLTADQDANEWHRPLAGVNHAKVWQQNCNIRSLSTVIVLRMTGSSRLGNEMFPREAARPVRTSDLEDCYWHVCSPVPILLVLLLLLLINLLFSCPKNHNWHCQSNSKFCCCILKSIRGPGTMAFMSLFSTLFTLKLGKSQRVGSWLLVTQHLIAFLPWIGWVFIPTGFLTDCIYCAFLIGWLNAFFTGLQIGSEQITRRCHRLYSSAQPTTRGCTKDAYFSTGDDGRGMVDW